MGWENSTRKLRLPANWASLRRQRLEIDGHRCTWLLPSGSRCPEKATDIDHIVPMTDDNRIEALRSLCSGHHARKSAHEGGMAWGAMRRQIAAKRFRPQPAHPGLRKAP